MSLTSLYLKNISRVFLYRPNEKKVYELHPVSKIVFTIFTTAIAIVSRPELVLTTLAVLVLLSIFLINWRNTFSLVISVFLFIAPMVFFVHIYTIIGNPIYVVLSTARNVGVAIARVMSMALSFHILFVSTKPQSLARVLNRIGIPYKYSYGFILALRFVSVIAGDLIEIVSIQKIRGLIFEKNLLKKLRSYLAIFIPLTISTLMRVDEIAISLEVKGFGYTNKRTYLYTETIKMLDVLVIMLCIAIAIFYPGI
ncbi:MAG: energy-coupling factor transporter transmembrane component T [Ignisphaera sp.]